MLEQGRLDGLLGRVAGGAAGVTNACTDSTLSWLMNEAVSAPNEPGSAMAPMGMSEHRRAAAERHDLAHADRPGDRRPGREHRGDLAGPDRGTGQPG